MSIKHELEEREVFRSKISCALSDIDNFDKKASEFLSISKSTLLKWSSGVDIPDRVFRIRVLNLISALEKHGR